jgi:hypothetical protein
MKLLRSVPIFALDGRLLKKATYSAKANIGLFTNRRRVPGPVAPAALRQSVKKMIKSLSAKINIRTKYKFIDKQGVYFITSTNLYCTIKSLIIFTVIK